MHSVLLLHLQVCAFPFSMYGCEYNCSSLEAFDCMPLNLFYLNQKSQNKYIDTVSDEFEKMLLC